MATSAPQTDAKAAVESALAAMRGRPLAAGARDLLAALGYESARIPALPDDAPQTFAAAFPAPSADTKSEREFLDAAQSVSILFQITDAEIAAQAQPGLFDGGADFTAGNARSFIFAAVALKPRHNRLPYSRSYYARFAREINKRIAVPAVALFQTQGADEISVAFINRRQSMTDAARDALGSVSVIRGVSLADPHRAHTDILAQLALPARLDWMDRRAKPQNFDGLLAAWLDALNTDALTDKFYKDLFAWFQRAVKDAKFPTDEAKTLSAEEHIIRLITRILFVWFIKEKGLVSADLFIENKVEALLKDYDAANGDSYYRAVLQNLFFATLNTEIARREFSSETQTTHRDFSRWRYKDQIADADTLTALFGETPFINGGLFDCLDSEPATTRGGYRIDCFSDNKRHYAKLSIPNRLFFDEQDGLIPLFDRYKFTVEENTPLEQEVALDPELLGNVFENLLAAHTPETADTARKQTGSYYTPRAVVDYMVDESLAAALAEKIAPAPGDNEGNNDGNNAADNAENKRRLAARLRQLLDYAHPYEDAPDPFTSDEREAIVKAVAELKIIDPAVGSGAFPMGILHKLTLALRRVDPDNKRWERLQIEIAGDRARDAFETPGESERNAELAEISRIFERYRDSDFGRKLYLIQNSIYGVDIQPVAAQIAKLRFFISLAIEQTPDRAAPNYGIRPLPNLETRFIAADALIGLRGLQGILPVREIDALQSQLRRNRENHFHAGTRRAKQRYSRQDKRLRAQLQAALQKYDFPAADAAKIADWDAFDHNAPAAEWFDAKYMFGVDSGFDVVIGNPPYVQLQKNGGEMRRKYQDAGFATFASTGDIYQLFYEKGVNLLTPGAGRLCFISSNQWMRVDSGRSTREFFESQNPETLVNLGAAVFENATVNTSILTVNRAPNANALRAADVRRKSQPFPPTEWATIRPANGDTWVVLSEIEQRVKDKMERVGTPLKDWDVSINYGLKTGYNKAFIIDNATRDALIASDPKSSEIIKPVLSGRDIQRYASYWKGSWLIYLPWHFPLHMDASIKGSSDDAERAFQEQYPAIYNHLLTHKARLSARNKTETGIRYEWYALQRWGANYHQEFAKDKIVWGNLANRPKFAYAEGGTFINAPSTMLTPYDPYLLAVLNSSLADWYFKLIGVERDGGYYEYKPMFIERIPVPRASASERSALVSLVDAVISAKASRAGAAPSAATQALEAQVDELVYGLYGLSAGEGEAIERSLGLIHPTDAAEDAALLRAMASSSGEAAVGAGEPGARVSRGRG